MSRIQKALDILQAIPPVESIPADDLWGASEEIEKACIELRAHLMSEDPDHQSWESADEAFDTIISMLEDQGLTLPDNRIGDLAREYVIYQQDLDSVLNDALQEAREYAQDSALLNAERLMTREGYTDDE